MAQNAPLGLDLTGNSVMPTGGTLKSTLAKLFGRRLSGEDMGTNGDFFMLGNATVVVGSSTTAVTASAYQFNPGDIGKWVAVPLADSTGQGLLVAKIASVSNGAAILNTTAATALSGTQPCWCGTDNAGAINALIIAAVAAGGPGKVYLGVGNFFCSVPIVDPGAVHVEGIGFQGGNGFGTVIFHGSTTQPCLLVNSGADCGSRFSNITFAQVHPAIPADPPSSNGQYTAQPTPWAPIVYPWVVDIQNTGQGAIIDNCFFFGVYDGVRVIGSGRVDIDMRGQFFNTAAFLNDLEDVNRIRHIHDWSFYSNAASVNEWTQTNSTGLVLARCDGLKIDYYFSIRKNIGVRVSRGINSEIDPNNADNTAGPALDIDIGTCYVDQCNIGVLQDGSYSRVNIGYLKTAHGSYFNGAPIPTSRAYVLTATGPTNLDDNMVAEGTASVICARAHIKSHESFGIQESVMEMAGDAGGNPGNGNRLWVGATSATNNMNGNNSPYFKIAANNTLTVDALPYRFPQVGAVGSTGPLWNTDGGAIHFAGRHVAGGYTLATLPAAADMPGATLLMAAGSTTITCLGPNAKSDGANWNFEGTKIPVSATMLPATYRTPEPEITEIAIAGDSFAQQSTSTGAFNSINAAGIGALNMLLGSPCIIDPVLDNGGVGGGNTAQMVQSVQSLLTTSKAQAIVLLAGHNDFIQGGTGAVVMAQAKANILTAINLCRMAGVMPILTTDPAMNTVESSSLVTLQQLRQANMELNTWKRQTARAMQLRLWDWYAALLDPTDPNGGSLVAAMGSKDFIHPNYLGGMLIGRRGVQDLASLRFQPTIGLTQSQIDLYDAINLPSGNLLSNPMFLATYTGGLGGGFSGTAPGSYSTGSGLVASGKTLTSAVVTDPSGSGANAWQATIGGTGPSDASVQNIYLSSALFGASLPAGTIVEGFVRVNVPAGSPWSGVFAKIINGSSQVIGNWFGANVAGYNNDDVPGPSYAWNGVIRIPPIAVPSGGAGLQLFLQAAFLDPAGTFAGTVLFSQPTLRIVPPGATVE